MSGKSCIVGIEGAGASGTATVDLLRAIVDIVGVGDDHICGVLAVPVEEGGRQVDDACASAEEDEHEDNHQNLESADHLRPLLADPV